MSADETPPGAAATLDDRPPPAGVTASGHSDRRPLLAGLAIGVAMLVVAVTVALSGNHSDGDAGGIVATGGGERTVAVKLIDLDVVPGEISVDPGTRLILEVTNDGGMRHDLAFPDGPATRMLDPGGSQRLDLGIVTTSRTGWCTVPGHKQAGMTLDIKVTGQQATDHTAGHAAAAGPDATIDPNATPASDFKPYPATLAPSKAGVHRVTLKINEQTIAVAPGVTQRMWTFGGSVPAPTLRGQVGDTFIVTLVNDTTMNHSIDFHASMVAPDLVMRDIAPGEQLVYEFTAKHAGAWMYHCATAPMTQHIANGMYGAVIIDPPHLAPVDAEYVLVQAELYLGPNGQIADADKVAKGTPDAVVFNNYYKQYRYSPLTAPAGGRARVWVVDAGLTRPSAFHVVGTQFDTVFSEGAYLIQPGNPTKGASQALALQPGQGGFVEFTLPAPGHYPFLSHLMIDAEWGASGMLTATP